MAAFASFFLFFLFLLRPIKYAFFVAEAIMSRAFSLVLTHFNKVRFETCPFDKLRHAPSKAKGADSEPSRRRAQRNSKIFSLPFHGRFYLAAKTQRIKPRIHSAALTTGFAQAGPCDKLPFSS